jgi:hypothetical protein
VLEGGKDLEAVHSLIEVLERHGVPLLQVCTLTACHPPCACIAQASCCRHRQTVDPSCSNLKHAAVCAAPPYCLQAVLLDSSVTEPLRSHKLHTSNKSDRRAFQRASAQRDEQRLVQERQAKCVAQPLLVSALPQPHACMLLLQLAALFPMGVRGRS